jgi:antitoxin ParD1/3/4
MQAAEKISVTMTPELMDLIRQSVEAGEYASASEALRDAVRVWKREREEHSERLAAIRARIDRSLADPRPDLSEDQVDAALESLFVRGRKDLRRA